MRRRFVTLDVFTETRFAGNPLAVVLEADGLDGAAMQTIASEFNLPETVFVLPPVDPRNRAKLRIFTPANELPFAGHPTVGTAVLLGRVGASMKPHELVLEENIGDVRCMVEIIDRERGRARFTSPRLPAMEGEGGAKTKETIAQAIGLGPGDIGFGNFKPGRWSAGLAFFFVPVKGLEAIGRARPNPALFDSVFGDKSPGRAYLFCAETAESGHHFHARMFAPGMGIPEDPATGSAAAAFAGLIAASGTLGDGEHSIHVEQGYEMKRPSLIELGLEIRGGALADVTIGGGTVMVSEGAIDG